MFRRCGSRLGHQLISEPMSLHEANTFARGRRTFTNMSNEMKLHAIAAFVGIDLALFCMYRSVTAPMEIVSAKGKITSTL